ncbi:energy transducer TonB family protein [Roseiterribacter gracilis]|uniref:TonB C-terminal domain-containing protein n=1 Tax=Roseiterribacter gracilis TaxID=2812848 RepID=A0A8S8XIT1_9PROT|nr:hypothetical protein TMPK1_41390 [Rhodospirillales bacterium TMPK1]
MADPRSPSARSRRALTWSVLAHLALLGALLLQLGAGVAPPPDPLDVTLIDPPPKPKPKQESGGSPAPTARTPLAAPSIALARVPPPSVLPAVLPPVAVRAQAPVGSGVGQGGVGTGTGRGAGPGNEDDYVERLRRHFNARSRSVEAPYDAPRFIQVRIVALIDQTGLLLRAEIQDGSGYARVDRAVLDQLRDMSPFPAPPAELHPPFRITMPLAFQTDRS